MAIHRALKNTVLALLIYLDLANGAPTPSNATAARPQTFPPLLPQDVVVLPVCTEETCAPSLNLTGQNSSNPHIHKRGLENRG